MEQVQVVHVQQSAKEELSIVQVEHQVVVQYQTDTTQQDVTDLIIDVQDKVNVQQVTTVQTEYQMPVVVENIVELENIMQVRNNRHQVHVVI